LRGNGWGRERVGEKTSKPGKIRNTRKERKKERLVGCKVLKTKKPSS